MPESCESCDDRIETCYGQECGLTQGQVGYCPLREVPEWTEEDKVVLQGMVEAQKCMNDIYKIYDLFTDEEATDLPSKLKVVLKLCQLAGVEVEND